MSIRTEVVLKMRHLVVVMVVAALGACAGLDGGAADTQVYVVRHAEVVKEDPDKPLTDSGKVRAQKLARHFADLSVTHVYASHTDRTRDTVTPLAAAHGLNVVQFPAPGSQMDGQTITNRTPGKMAVKPLVAAIRALPGGSTAVVAGNSGNLYALLAGLGVRVDPSCTPESSDCIPCAEKTCFPEKQFNNIWKLRLNGDRVKMVRTTYGE